MTDLEVVDDYIESCHAFIEPRKLGEITRRGLYHVINYLPRDKDEAKAVARARMSKMGKYIGDPEIEKIAGTVDRAEYLRKQLIKVRMSDAHKVKPILEELMELNEFLLDYYKRPSIP